MKVLFFGDSITQGFWDIEGGWAGRIRKHYDKLALADLEHNEQPYIFNVGISGETTRSLLQRIEAETRARVWRGEPVVVAVAIGTNDDLFESDEQWVTPEEFRANLEQIVTILKPLAARIILIGNPAVDEARTVPVFWGDFNYTNRELERSERVIGEVAARHDLAYVPIYGQFKARLDAGDDLLSDGLHPNGDGHQLMSDLILPVLQRELAAAGDY